MKYGMAMLFLFFETSMQYFRQRKVELNYGPILTPENKLYRTVRYKT